MTHSYTQALPFMIEKHQSMISLNFIPSKETDLGAKSNYLKRNTTLCHYNDFVA